MFDDFKDDNYDECEDYKNLLNIQDKYAEAFYQLLLGYKPNIKKNNSVINNKEPQLSNKEKAEILMTMINYTLDCGNKEEFMKYSEEYNQLMEGVG